MSSTEAAGLTVLLVAQRSQARAWLAYWLLARAEVGKVIICDRMDAVGSELPDVVLIDATATDLRDDAARWHAAHAGRVAPVVVALDASAGGDAVTSPCTGGEPEPLVVLLAAAARRKLPTPASAHR